MKLSHCFCFLILEKYEARLLVQESEANCSSTVAFCSIVSNKEYLLKSIKLYTSLISPYFFPVMRSNKEVLNITHDYHIRVSAKVSSFVGSHPTTEEVSHKNAKTDCMHGNGMNHETVSKKG